jgi:hypothetical protein
MRKFTAFVHEVIDAMILTFTAITSRPGKHHRAAAAKEPQLRAVVPETQGAGRAIPGLGLR